MISPPSNLDLFLLENRDVHAALSLLRDQCSKVKFTNILFSREETIKDTRTYSDFMLTKFPTMIVSSHVLVTQLDGYILNKEAWTDEFLEYDYIGAPWTVSLGTKSYPQHPIVTYHNIVGNGGFSLRSKKLSLLVRERYLDLLSKGESPEIGYPEDCFICLSQRDWLESNGIRFAPEELANRFSVENQHYNKQFGFHGLVTMRINNIEKI